MFSDRDHAAESLLSERLAGKDGVGVGALLLAAMELWPVGGALLSDGRPRDGSWGPDLGQNRRLLYFTVGVIGIKPPRGVLANFCGIVISGEQEMITSVWIGMDEVLIGAGWRRDEGALDVNLVLALTMEGWKVIAEGTDVVFNVIHIAEVKIGDPLPQHGIGPDGPGGAG